LEWGYGTMSPLVQGEDQRSNLKNKMLGQVIDGVFVVCILVIFLLSSGGISSTPTTLVWLAVIVGVAYVCRLQWEKMIYRRVRGQLQDSLQTMEYLAYHDVLSDLPNRRLFEDRLSMAMHQAKRKDHRVAVLFMDLDKFKNINDTLGHAFGDELIRSVAERLKSCIREGDTLSRQGGDEFTLLLNNIEQATDVLSVVKRIQQKMQERFVLFDQELLVTTSIGIAMYPEDATDSETLMKHADIAMYKAKETGRNNYQFFRNDMNELFHKKVALESALSRAIERNEFLLHYQQQLDIRSNEIIGVEALVRWQSPELGLVPPVDFIPLAEETGSILAIGEFVLRTACQDTKSWLDRGFPPLKVSVNISPMQFKKTDLVRVVTSILEETGLDPQYLELEITETLAMHDVKSVIGILFALRDIGVKVAIDDFGTGYSSLSYLSKFPINTLKIDKTFIDSLSPETMDDSLVAAIIALAKSMKFNVVAEGVEDPCQLGALGELHCHEVQGYLISRPLPKEDFIEFFAAYSKLDLAFEPI
jgi:diguanylate cyclase